MNSPRKICVTAMLIAVFLCAPVYGDSIEQLFQAALDNDIQLRVLAMALESRQIAINRGNLDKNFDLGAGLDNPNSGDDGIVYHITAGDAGSQSLTLYPYVFFSLPEGIETRVDVAANLAFDLTGGADPETDPTLSVTQPINPLIGLEPSERGKRLAEATSMYQARIDIWNRERAVKKMVIGKVKQVLSLERALGDAERNLRNAEDDLAIAKLVDTFKDDSVESIQLNNAVNRAARALELEGARLDLAIRDLEELTGRNVGELPRELPPQPLDAPGSFDMDMHPSTQSSRMAVEKAEIALEEHLERFVPQYSIGASYSPSFSDTESQTVGASIDAGFENLSIGTSLTASFGGESDSSLETGISIRWSLPDYRAKNLQTRELELALESARLQHESTVKGTALSVESLRLKIHELEVRRVGLAERIHLEERKLRDTAKRFELGAVGEKELRSAEWAFEKLHVDALLLEYDALGLRLDIEALEFPG